MSAFIDQQRAAGFAVELTCRSIGTSPSAYYQRATGQPSTRAVEDARLLAQIRAEAPIAHPKRRPPKPDG